MINRVRWAQCGEKSDEPPFVLLAFERIIGFVWKLSLSRNWNWKLLQKSSGFNLFKIRSNLIIP